MTEYKNIFLFYMVLPVVMAGHSFLYRFTVPVYFFRIFYIPNFSLQIQNNKIQTTDSTIITHTLYWYAY